MVKTSLLTSLALAISIGFSGIIAPSVSANTPVPIQNVQSQPLIEHVKSIKTEHKGIFSTAITEEWFNPQNGFLREDNFVKEQEKITLKSKVRQYPNQKSLLKETIDRYQDKDIWTYLGVDTLNGQQVKKLKTIIEPKSGIYHIAYVNSSTGLPIKEDKFDNQNDLLATYVYFYDKVTDPNGAIFEVKEKNLNIDLQKTK
ncbi:hypothetical protein BP422_24315 [Brevibacillus formosus]|uniref:Uncharacterized protein n=1 Tax=Brevibacillus formosus TaxID=54913 RepID=A0A220MN94_9BACL|nr:hypothetical protein [Brevibacillus formosus]ASJ56413.1 hypothetical protein BP422_24315 [Brevibacillus formosus]